MEVAEYWEFYNSPRARVKMVTAVLPHSTEHGLETHFHRIPISNHCAHPDGLFDHRTQRLTLL